ncbi:hypothetical protein [Pararhodospirillum oryzae]|nr:hypothetical protein [Pararhodospirillum oryzae]
MPFPLIVLIPTVLGGLFGVGKTIEAAVNNSDADEINNNAEELVKNAEEARDSGRNACNYGLKSYGEKKLSIIDKEIRDFISIFSRLKNVSIEHSPELERLNVGDFTEVSLQSLKHSCSFADDFAVSAAAGAGAGAITAFGAYGGTMMLASAGTGTAIGTLSGAAATNATLAWLGGGTLAAGGYGIAGGTLVLGSLVAGPALLVLGSILGAQASKKLDEARANLEKARTFEAEVKVVLEKLKAILEVTDVGWKLLEDLRSRLYDSNVALRELTKIFGVDYSTYPNGAKDSIFMAVKYAQLTKLVIDTPILSEDGSLAEGVLFNFNGVKECLEK